MDDFFKNFISVGLSGWFFGSITLFILIYNLIKNTKKCKRKKLAQILAPFWQQNHEIFMDKPSEIDDSYYDLTNQEKANKWKTRVKKIMIPNHNQIIIICKKNYNLMNSSEKELFKEYEDHVASFTSYHLDKTPIWKLFPDQITQIFKEKK